MLGIWLMAAMAAQELPVTQELPIARELVREALDRQRQAARDLTEYTFDVRTVMRRFGERGQLRSETVETGELYQSGRRSIQVTLVRNGKPQSAGRVAQQRRQAAEQMQKDYEERRRGQWGSDGPEYGVSYGEFRMETYETLRRAPVTKLRREQMGGREVFVLELGPATISAKMPYLTKLRGTAWIDAEDRVVRAWKLWDLAGALVFEQRWERLAPGVWAGGYFRANPAAAPAVFPAHRFDWSCELTHARRFSVEVEQKIAAPVRE